MKRSISNHITAAGSHAENGTDLISALSEVSKLVYDTFKKTAFEHNGRPKSFKLILHALYKKDNVTQLDIVKSTGLKPPTVSIALQKMEKEQLVTRTPDPIDLRAVRVKITDKCRMMFSSSIKSAYEAEESILQGISEDEIKTFLSVLSKMKENLLELDDATTDGN